MAIWARTGGIGLGLVGAALLAAAPLVAQEPAAPKQDAAAQAPAAKPAPEPARRVPDFFGQIALTSAQKEDVYKIRATHQKKIAELEKQIAQIRAEMMTECESVLTPTQKTLLADKRKASAEAKAARKAASDKARQVGGAPKKEAN
jgi:hypothetical protein